MGSILGKRKIVSSEKISQKVKSDGVQLPVAYH